VISATGCSWGCCYWLRQYQTAVHLSKTLNLTKNEIANDECSLLPVMWCNFGWFQPQDARVTCHVCDVETNIRIYIKLFSGRCGWPDGWLYRNF